MRNWIYGTKGQGHDSLAKEAKEAKVRLYENIIDEEKGVYNEDGSLNLNPNSLKEVTAYVEPELMKAKAYESFQFVREMDISVRMRKIPRKESRYLTGLSR